MSYTVILVEDEYFTLKELVETINWKGLGLEIVGTASDGIKGEALIKDECPDIVITDIRLPGQDGLAMLQHAMPTNAIILSGHTDFSFTRQAIQLGVFDYIQKPVDDDELERTLSRLVAKIQEENLEIEKLKTPEALIKLPEETDNHLVNSVIDFIKKNHAQQISLSDAASSVALSEGHLSTLFKQETGINFLQYLNAYRINKSYALMNNPKLNIAEIAAESGFTTPGYYTKIFKRFIGVTPTTYRDENRKKGKA